MNFVELLGNTFSTKSDQPAMMIDGQTLSYTRFLDRIQSITAHLGRGERIGLITTYDGDCYASILAIWLTGNTYIPLEPGNWKTETKRLNIDRVVSSVDTNSNDVNIPFILTPNCIEKHEIHPSYTGDSIAYILSTSGTTGQPKDIPISYTNLSCFVDSFLDLNVELSSEDSFLQMAELRFDMSIIAFLIPMCIGASVHTIPMSDMRYLQVFKTMERNNTTICIAPPSAIKLLEPYHEEINLPSLRYTFFGAEELKTNLVKAWTRCASNSTIINLYGPSEGGIFSTAYICDQLPESDSIPIGYPAKHIRCMVLEGELLISGDQVFSGYENTHSNQSAFLKVDDRIWYRTGDLVSVNVEGAFVFEKRRDRQLKVSGKRVSSGAIENLTGKEGIRSLVVPITTSSAVDSYALYVEGETDKKNLKELLKQNNFPVPFFIHEIDQIEMITVPAHKRNHLNYTGLLDLCEGTKDNSGFKATASDSSAWPNYVYDIHNPDQSLKVIQEEMAKGELPNTLILEEEQFLDFEEVLQNSDLIPTSSRYLMRMNTHQYGRTMQGNSGFKLVDHESDLTSWIKLAEQHFGKQNRTLFQKLNQQRQIDLLMVTEDGLPVGCAMLYTRNGTTGIYHVGVTKDRQNKGIGSTIAHFCLEVAKTHRSYEVALQTLGSTQVFWNKMGFENTGNLYLFTNSIQQ